MPSIWTYSDPSDRGYGLFKRKIFAALATFGWDTHIAEAPLLDADSKSILREDLLSYPADWIFLINQPVAQFYEYLEIQSKQQPLPQKFLVWYLDDPHFFIHQPLEANEHVLCFDETYLDHVMNYKPAWCGFFPLAADMEEEGCFDPAYQCDVSFVGGLIDQSGRRNQLPPEMQAYIDLLVEEKLRQPYLSFDQLSDMHPFAPGKKIDLSPQVHHYLYWETNNRYRIRLLEALGDFDLHIYGNEDWNKVAAGSPVMKHFKGPADPVKQLPAIFVSSKINLNIHSVQCRGSLNQRDFNAPIAGGFLLSDWVPASARYFDPGEEAVYFKDIKDLRAKINYYLKHPEERNRIIKSGRKNVLQQHTYLKRVEQLMYILDLL